MELEAQIKAQIQRMIDYAFVFDVTEDAQQKMADETQQSLEIAQETWCRQSTIDRLSLEANWVRLCCRLDAKLVYIPCLSLTKAHIC